jgi:hypothetical protein
MDVSLTVELADFESLSSDEQQDAYLDLIWAIVHVNCAWLARGRRFATIPRLYTSGVRFRISEAERNGVGNTGQNIPAILRVGYAHCIGLVAWRVAELKVRDGVEARPAVTEFREERSVGLVQEFHFRVWHPDGSIEDPSHALGMP